MRPLIWILNITVFDRIPMNVIEMSFKVSFISNQMIPESRLPKTKRIADTMSRFIVESEIPFDAVQNNREITACIIGSHEPVKVVRQDYVSQQTKRMDTLNASQSFKKQRDIVFSAQVWDAVFGDTSYKDNCTRNIITIHIVHRVCSPLWAATESRPTKISSSPNRRAGFLPAAPGGYGKPIYKNLLSSNRGPGFFPAAPGGYGKPIYKNLLSANRGPGFLPAALGGYGKPPYKNLFAVKS